MLRVSIREATTTGRGSAARSAASCWSLRWGLSGSRCWRGSLRRYESDGADCDRQRNGNNRFSEQQASPPEGETTNVPDSITTEASLAMDEPTALVWTTTWVWE